MHEQKGWCIRDEVGATVTRFEDNGTPIWTMFADPPVSVLVWERQDPLVLRDVAEKTTTPGWPIRKDLYWAEVTIC